MNDIIFNHDDIVIAEELIYYIKKHREDSFIQITYGKLSNLIKARYVVIKPLDLKFSLDKISRFYHEKGFPFISGIVINKKTGFPGDGYFSMIADYGIGEVQQMEEMNKAQHWKDWKSLKECLDKYLRYLNHTNY